jgi:L-ribulose-5-phosphate 4-epimerase
VSGSAPPAGEAELREAVANGCRILYENGHDDFIWGHVSTRAADRRGAWIKRAGIGFDEVTAADVLLVDPDGEVLAGEGRRHSEWPIHLEVLAARPDLGAVVHSHPPHAIALICAGQPLRPLTHAGTLFVPPDLPLYEKSSNLIVDREEGRELAAALGEASALFIVNHGIVVGGATVEEAVVKAVMLESACRQQVLASAAGGELTWPDQEESLRKRARAWPPAHISMLWDYLLRKHERAAHNAGRERGG